MKKISIVILALFLASLIIVANGQIRKNGLASGEVRFVTNENCAVKVDQVRFEEAGLMVQVTNTGTYNVDLDAHGRQPDYYFVPQTLQKLDASGEWVEIPFLEDACVDADCLPLVQGETISMSVTWEDGMLSHCIQALIVLRHFSHSIKEMARIGVIKLSLSLDGESC